VSGLSARFRTRAFEAFIFTGVNLEQYSQVSTWNRPDLRYCTPQWGSCPPLLRNPANWIWVMDVTTMGGPPHRVGHACG
jgi:hypothetical protein